jgi:3-hexulose-6-phosphate synthase/6-phospho-3-hexuloisomerase
MRVTNSATACKLMNLGTAALSDALGKSGALDHDMRCLSAKAHMAGPAFTVRVHTADILMVAEALSDCGKGEVLVIDGQGELNTALWGELTTLAALRKGLAGVVIDGAVRDIAAIRRSTLPVFARAVVPNAGGAEYLGNSQVTVQCGGQVVRPGDWVIGDEDGVVVIPAEHVSGVQARAKQIVEAETLLEQEIRKGADLGQLLRTHEVIQRKQSEVFIPQLRTAARPRRSS